MQPTDEPGTNDVLESITLPAPAVEWDLCTGNRLSECVPITTSDDPYFTELLFEEDFKPYADNILEAGRVTENRQKYFDDMHIRRLIESNTRH